MIWLFTPLYGNGYQFWSGIGSDIGEITLISAAITWYFHNQCHVEGCRKIGKHPFKQYKLCSKHHPSTPEKVTHQHVVKLHKESK
jgi:hypothetical protein